MPSLNHTPSMHHSPSFFNSWEDLRPVESDDGPVFLRHAHDWLNAFIFTYGSPPLSLGDVFPDGP